MQQFLELSYNYLSAVCWQSVEQKTEVVFSRDSEMFSSKTAMVAERKRH